MNGFLRLSGLSAVILVLATSGAARAGGLGPPPPGPPTPLPAAAIYGYVGVAGSGPYLLTGAGTVSVPAGAAGGSGQITATLGSDPSVSFAYDNTSFVADEAGGSGSVDMFYSAEYYDAALGVNPTNQTASVTMFANDILSQNGAGTAEATLTVTGPNGFREDECITGVGWNGCVGTAVHSGAPFAPVNFQMVENQVYTVELFVHGYGGFNSGIDGAASASIDPIFSTQATDGAFYFSQGVVPEPATWALIISGFGVAGAALRRRRPARAV